MTGNCKGGIKRGRVGVVEGTLQLNYYYNIVQRTTPTFKSPPLAKMARGAGGVQRASMAGQILEI